MNKPEEIIIKPALFNRIVIFLFGIICIWFAFATDFLPQTAGEISLKNGLLSPWIWHIVLLVIFGVMGLSAFIVVFAPYKVKITPAGIQGPICLSPVPWQEIQCVEYHKIRRTEILTFYMKEGSFARVRILYLFPAKQKSFAIVLTQYNADNQQKILETVKQYTIVRKK